MYRKLTTLLVCLLMAEAGRSATIQWGTYFGSTNREFATAVTTDRNGNIYMVGNTASPTGIATPGSFQTIYGGEVGSTGSPGDAFIAKFNAAGRLQWATYFGGPDDDGATSIGCDTNGRLYISGWTRSNSGIATSGTHQSVYGGSDDAFLACFDTSGQRLWATYYGGSGDENNPAIGGLYVAPDGSCYLTGKTSSPTGIATTGSHQPTYQGGISDGFLVKFNRNGQRIWGSYYGNSNLNLATVGNAVCGHGNAIFIAGYTTSTSGISSMGSYQPAFNGGTNDAFLARFDTTGVLQWGTYLGGSLDDRGIAVACNANLVYLTGTTYSTSQIATTGAYQTTQAGNQDVFIAQFNWNGQLNWSTYYGGPILDGAASSMELDPIGSVYITGNTTSTSSIATAGSIQPLHSGNRDVFVTKFNSSGARQWGTYLGGTAADYGLTITSNKAGMVYVAGRTLSATNIATTGAQQSLLAGDNDAFLIAINDCSPISKPDTVLGPTEICANSSHTYRVPPVPNTLSYTWKLPSGWSGTSNTDSIVVQSGTSGGTIKVYANGICSQSDTQRIEIAVDPVPVISPLSPRICSGDSVLLTSSSVPGSLQWYRDGSLLTGLTTNSIYGKLAGSYYVVNSSGSCTDTAASVNLIVNPLPVVPTITKTGQVLSLPVTFITYQWNYNGQAITGATSATYTYSIEGNYSVTITDSNGCRNTSPVINTNSNAITSIETEGFTFYPNPVTNGYFQINASYKAIMEIVAIDSRHLKQIILVQGSNEINVVDLPKGIYILRFIDNAGTLISNNRLSIQ